MSLFGMSDVVTFLMAIGVCLVFAAIWMIASERRRNILRAEMKKLKSLAASYEREKFMLLEKVSMLESSPAKADQDMWGAGSAETERELQEARRRIDALEAENKRLKRESEEARGSLEEVYKALK